MKNIIATTACLLLFFALSCAANPVIDSDGNQVTVDQRYFIMQRNKPVLGLTTGNSRSGFCPRSVVRVPDGPPDPDVSPEGLPVAITPVNNTDGIIRDLEDVNISFWTVSACPESSNVWKVDSRDEVTGKRFIITGGVEGNPGAETINNWFKIVKMDSDYKLIYCPSVCKECRPMCSNIGLFSDGGRLHLVLSNSPLKVFFKWA